MNGDMLIAWTIRLALLLLFVVVVLQMQRHSGRRAARWLRCLWTAGFVMSALHIIAAFHFVHNWSHNSAYLATSQETLQKLGFAFGVGVYFNYLFVAVWGMDVCWCWFSSSGSMHRVPWMIRIGRGYLLFIAFNSVVVFKAGWLRIVGGMASAVLVWIVIQNRRQAPRNQR